MPLDNLNIEQLRSEGMSSRTYNICKYNGLNDINTILNYFNKNHNFLNLRNCGEKSNSELTNLCHKYNNVKYLNDLSTGIFTEFVPSKFLEGLNSKQKSIVKSFIQLKHKSLSNLSRNKLHSLLEEELTLSNLDKLFSIVRYKDSSILNPKTKSAKELSSFVDTIEKLIMEISEATENDLVKFKLNILLNSIFLSNGIISSQFQLNPINNKIPIFKLINTLISSGQIFSDKENFVFKSSLGCYLNENKITLEKIGEKLSITRERARQIKNKLLQNFNNYLSFLENIDSIDIETYNLVLSKSLLLDINDSFYDIVRKNENVNFSNNCFNFFLSRIFKDRFTLIGSNYYNLSSKFVKKYKWKYTYLISNNIANIFDFDKLLNDVALKLNNSSYDNVSLELNSYLAMFKKAGFREYLENYTVIEGISKHLLLNELNILILHDNVINFKNAISKTSNKIIDFAYNILKEEKKPMHISNILNNINNKYNLPSNINSLRTGLINDERIISFGKNSIYGLKEWELKNNKIKGGTMHDLADEFLQKFDSPKHIEDITDYVSKYRGSISSRSLYYNLKSAEGRRFVFFEKRLIGLATKNYILSNDSNVIKTEVINKKNNDYISKRTAIKNKHNIIEGLSNSSDKGIIDNVNNPFAKRSWIAQNKGFSSSIRERLKPLFNLSVDDIISLAKISVNEYVYPPFNAIRWGFAKIKNNKLVKTEKFDTFERYDKFGNPLNK